MIDLTELVVLSARKGINLSVVFEVDGIRIYAERKIKEEKLRCSKFVYFSEIRMWEGNQKLWAAWELDHFIEKIDYETERAIAEGRI